MQTNYYNSINKNCNNQNSAFMTLNSLRETSDMNELNYSTIDTILLPDYKQYTNYPHRPLTKQVNQLAYELPKKYQYSQIATHGTGSCAPEFLKVFSDMSEPEGAFIIFDCVLLGIPRPRVCWLFNNERVNFLDVRIDDTADLCRLTIPHVNSYHYGVYTVIAENEVGRALTSATLLPSTYYE